MRMRAVFNQMNPRCVADFQDQREVDRHPVEMNNKQGFGLARESAANLLQVWSEIPVLDIDQHRARLEPPYRFQCSNKGVGWQNDFIPLTDAAGGQPQEQRLSARGSANHMGYA